MALSPSLLTSLILPVALLLGEAAHAQQASFTVSVILHTAPKAMAATQLCPEGRPLSRLALASVRVDCPVGMGDKTAPSQNTGSANSGASSKPSEVVVSF